MRRCLFALATLLGACVPAEYDWLVTGARFRGILVEVVEPGGYGSLLKVPPDRSRAFVLPLDTVELEWKVAVPPGSELQPPIWIACSSTCSNSLWDPMDPGMPDCPDPMPIELVDSCRLGEGHRIRVHMGGAYAVGTPFTLLLVGSRRPDLTPEVCLERLFAPSRAQLEPCIIALRDPPVSDSHIGLPFLPDSAWAPPEVLAAEADTNPTVLGFTVTRERGDVREELVVDVGAAVPVRRGDRIVAEPRFAADASQEYWVEVGGTPGIPWSGELELETEQFSYDVLFSQPVDYEPPDYRPPGATTPPPSWVVPHDVVPTTLWLDIADERDGHAFVELRFVPEDDA
ncbi:hypothetical protein [Nannocystis punicea]|uniref:Uncharacterized protein n=1 Tax=Nannocystis punicea TaxID=2995304 RepID=A0ABY7H6R4_9BACT|nr:hypothetical protein [Nannocystis poenicansa]WAS94961.1 hypothetical protein O0S08_02265 [Nannocystis poenicansa]